MLLHDYCQGVRPRKDFKERNNYGTICPFPRQQMYNGPISNHVPVYFMAMPRCLKENFLILSTISTSVPKRKTIFRDEYCKCISRAQMSSRENREVGIMKYNLKAEIPKGSIQRRLEDATYHALEALT